MKTSPAFKLVVLGMCAAGVVLAVRIDDMEVSSACRFPGIPNPKLEAIYRQARAAVVQIKAGSGIGTAFLISSDGLAITAKHVAMASKSLSAKTLNGTKVKVKLVDLHPKLDFAAIKLLGGHQWAYLKLSPAKIKLNDTAFAIGNSCGDFLKPRFGKVIALPEKPRSNRPKTLLELDLPVSPGDSGAPVLNAQGQVIGEVIEGGEDALGFSSFAVPVIAFKTWLQSLSK